MCLCASYSSHELVLVGKTNSRMYSRTPVTVQLECFHNIVQSGIVLTVLCVFFYFGWLKATSFRLDFDRMLSIVDNNSYATLSGFNHKSDAFKLPGELLSKKIKAINSIDCVLCSHYCCCCCCCVSVPFVRIVISIVMLWHLCMCACVCVNVNQWIYR